jgi:hypothetical protein
MAKRPGHVDVVTEVGFCNFCNRTRNLRREEHHLGGLVRAIVSCETCHRTLSSTIGVEPAQAEPEPEPSTAEAPAAEAQPERAPAKKAAAKKTAAKKTAAREAATPKPKTPPRPRSTATRKTTRTR